MRDYELTLVVNPETPEENFNSVIEKVSQLITQKGGSIVEVNRWGKRKLAYPIKHFMEGNYVLAQFKLEPKFIVELETNLRLPEEILRYLVVRLGD